MTLSFTQRHDARDREQVAQILQLDPFTNSSQADKCNITESVCTSTLTPPFIPPLHTTPTKFAIYCIAGEERRCSSCFAARFQTYSWVPAPPELSGNTISSKKEETLHPFLFLYTQLRDYRNRDPTETPKLPPAMMPSLRYSHTISHLFLSGAYCPCNGSPIPDCAP